MKTLMLFLDLTVPCVETQLEDRDLILENDLVDGEEVEVSRDGGPLQGWRIDEIRLASTLKTGTFHLLVLRAVSGFN
jgi:hypothetical protein